MATKKFVFKSKPTDAVGNPMKQIAAVKGPNTAMSAVINILTNHVAEVFHAIVDGISEKYAIDKEEMMAVILNHPAYVEITGNPVINDIETLTGEPAPKEVPNPVEGLDEVMGALSSAEPAPVPPVAPKFKIKKAVAKG
jgi:hypothetical protein